MILGNIDGDGDTAPQFVATEQDGELVVLVRARRGASDDDIIRAARRQAKTLLPARIDRSDNGLDPPRNVENLWGVRSLVGWRPELPAVPEHPTGIVLAKNVDEVYAVDVVRAATVDERQEWGAQDDTHAEWVEKGGGVVVIEVTRQSDGVEGTWTIADRYSKPFAGVWVVPLDQHWPRCSTCRQPWPCTHREQQTAEFIADSWERRTCYRCGKTDGNQHEFRRADGFPERRSYHTRKGACLNAAIRYANEHGWVLQEGSGGWRNFKPAPDEQAAE